MRAKGQRAMYKYHLGNKILRKLLNIDFITTYVQTRQHAFIVVAIFEKTKRQARIHTDFRNAC